MLSIFRKKIQEREVKKAAKQVSDNQAQNAASKIFQDDYASKTANQPTEEELREKSKLAEELIQARQNAIINERNFGNQVKKIEKPKETDSQKTYSGESFNIMNQFGKSEGNENKNKKKKGGNQ